MAVVRNVNAYFSSCYDYQTSEYKTSHEDYTDYVNFMCGISFTDESRIYKHSDIAEVRDDV